MFKQIPGGVTLPASSAIKPGDALDLEILEDGRIVLVPIEPVPRHQLWAWTIESKEAISASLSDPRPAAVVETAEEAEETAKRWAVLVSLHTRHDQAWKMIARLPETLF